MLLKNTGKGEREGGREGINACLTSTHQVVSQGDWCKWCLLSCVRLVNVVVLTTFQLQKMSILPLKWKNEKKEEMILLPRLLLPAHHTQHTQHAHSPHPLHHEPQLHKRSTQAAWSTAAAVAPRPRPGCLPVPRPTAAQHAHPSSTSSKTMPAHQHHHRSLLPLLPLLLLASLLLLLPQQATGVNALVCPEEMQGPLNQPEGGDCGGPCGQLGSCAPGLICRPVSDFAEEQAEQVEEGEEGMKGGMEGGVGGPMLSSKLADLVHHSLGRAPRGVCVPEESMEESNKESDSDEMGGGGSFWGQRARARKAAAATETRELGERMAITGEDDLLRPEGSLHASQQQQKQQQLEPQAETRNASPAKEPRQGSCPGCPHEVEVSDPEVVAAAKAGVELMKARGDLGSGAESNNLSLGVILSATSQVVAGIRYKIVLSVVRGGGGGEGVWEVDVVSQPWMNPKYTLVGAKKVPRMEGGY